MSEQVVVLSDRTRFGSETGAGMDFEQVAFRKVRSGWTGDDEGFTADQIAEFTKTYGEWASALEAALGQANDTKEETA